MAEQFIEEIYQYSNIVYELERTVEYIRLFYDSDAVTHLDHVFPKLASLCETIIKDDLETGKKLWERVKAISTITTDLTAIGDNIELQILPFLRTWLASIADIDVTINDKYSMLSTASGYLTIYDRSKDLLLHSRNDPMLEAMQYVRSFYDTSKSEYYVFGAGMGYAVYQLYKQSEGFTHIILFEPDDLVYDTAVSYGVLGWIPNDQLERRHYADTKDFLSSAAKENAGILINITSAHSMEDGSDKNDIITHWMLQNTIRQYDADIRSNRLRNAMLGYPEAEEYVISNQCEEAVVVAAGPSLSDSMDLLKKWKGDKTIIAVGRTLSKLLNEGIVPDCSVIIDPQEIILKQLPDKDDSRVPILLDDNAYWKFPRLYKGKMYFMKNWSYGGTVSSAAIEVALRMGAKTIYLIGLDLGYAELQSHAEGINGSRQMSKTGLFMVERTDGKKIYTDKHLDYYRKQIEIQISNHPDTTFYNMSSTGAKITGTRIYGQ